MREPAYLISGTTSDLNEYRAVAPQVIERLQRLKKLVGDNPVQLENCAQLESTIRVRLQAWEDSITRKQQNKPVDYPALLQQNLDLASKGAAATEAILSEEAKLLLLRKRLAQRAFVLAGVVVIASFALALILLYVYQRSLVTELRTRAAAERAAIDALAREMVFRQNEERFRLFIEAVQDYAIFTLDAEGRVSSWNKGAERLNGYATSEIIGKHFSCFYPEEDRAIKPPIELAGAISDGRFEDEGWRIRKDGSRFWANVVIASMRDHTGQGHWFRQGHARLYGEKRNPGGASTREYRTNQRGHRTKVHREVAGTVRELSA